MIKPSENQKNVSRRKSYLIISICILLISVAFQGAAQKQIGLATYSVKGIESDPDKAFERIKNIGYTTIEIANYRDGKVFDMEPAAFKNYLKKYGITVTSSHTRAEFNLDEEKATLSAWSKILDDHAAMGCTYVIIPSYDWGDDMSKIKASCDLFNKIGKIAKSKGLTLGYHSHNFEFNTIGDTGIKLQDYIIQNTNPEYVIFELDVYWAYQGGQNPVEWLQKYPDRIKLLHIKDYYVIGASGKIDYEKIFKQFYKNGHKGFYVEMENDMGMETADKVAKWSFNRNKTSEPIPEEIMKLFRQAGANLDKSLDGIEASYKYLNSADFVK